MTGESEEERVKKACELSLQQLDEIMHKAKEAAGEEAEAVFAMHKMLMINEDYQKAIQEGLRQEKEAEDAVRYACDRIAQELRDTQDVYLADRAKDIEEISQRILENLNGSMAQDVLQKPSIIVARDLSASGLMELDPDKVLGVVLTEGSRYGHVCILASMMRIPVLIQTEVKIDELKEGTWAAIDGESHEFTVYQRQSEIRIQDKSEEDFTDMIGKETVTKSGRKIRLSANIYRKEDVQRVLENDGEGIGLFRTEFLYLGRSSAPGEEEQFEVYKEILTAMKDKPVVIRTMDLGSDKKPDYLDFGEEANPAMGVRAIRFSLKEKTLFMTQLRALLRASVYGNLAVLYPMVSDEKEIQAVKETVYEVQEQLRKEGYSFRDISMGIMIETPAAAILSDRLAPYIDFFSIGTNDLTQYTLAADRENAGLMDYYKADHEAVMRLIGMAVNNAHAVRKPVCICGDIAADAVMTQKLIELGVDSLSVTPDRILEIRRAVREIE